MPRPLKSLRACPAILFVGATRIGDAVLSTGLLRRLIERYPGARLTIAAGPVAAPLFRGVPGLETLIAMPKQPYGLHWLSLYARVAARRWNLVVDLRASALTALLWAQDRRRIGKQGRDTHRVTHLGRLLDLAPVPAPRIWTLPENEAAAERLIPSGGATIGIGPTANWAGKIWPPERFAAVIGQLTAPGARFAGARIAIFAAEHERALAQPVIAAVPPAALIDLVGQGDLLTVAAALRRTDLFIGNDSGLMHLAAAAGAPTLGLFGPSPAAQYAAWGPHTALVQTETPYRALVGAADFDHRTTGSLMGTLSVDRVVEAAMALAARMDAVPDRSGIGLPVHADDMPCPLPI